MPRFADRFKAHGRPVIEREHGVCVTLNYGDVSSDEFTARRRSRFIQSYGEEIALNMPVEVRSYILPKADCVIDSTVVKPQAGWTITDDEVWTVHHPDASTPAVENHQDGYDWIVHARRVL